jgi:hypothetical protein
VETIRGGKWCEQQGSLMRGLAFGILDPDGERYRLALLHRGECPACRAYVLSLRGLAAALPPVLAPSSFGAAALALAGRGSHVPLRAAASGASSAASGGGGAAAGVSSAAGGVQVLAAKLAVGCLLALGVGAGCVALEQGHGHWRRAPRWRDEAASAGVAAAIAASAAGRALAGAAPRSSPPAAKTGRGSRAAARLTSEAGREFGPEQRVGLAASDWPAVAVERARAQPAKPAAAAAQREFAPG